MNQILSTYTLKTNFISRLKYLEFKPISPLHQPNTSNLQAIQKDQNNQDILKLNLILFPSIQIPKLLKLLLRFQGFLEAKIGLTIERQIFDK